MNIKKYRTELNQDMHNILVEESAIDYDICEASEEAFVTMLNDVFRLNKKAEEFLYMIALNTKCRILGVFEIAHGTVNATYTSPRELFIRALLVGATSIIIAHNHPSGDVTPSRSDLSMTRNLLECSKIMNIPLLDHIIVGQSSFRSLKKDGLI